jgi:glucokinase
VAPGTGLGEAFLVWNGDRYSAYPSEGGHGDFAPGNQREAELLSWLRQRHGHVSWEQVCSGMGIPNLYQFLADTGSAAKPEQGPAGSPPPPTARGRSSRLAWTRGRARSAALRS